MKKKEEKKVYDIGVIVGRFQIHELHDGQKELIDSVIKRHDKVIIFLGVAPTLSTKRNPLDFRSRKVMIESTYDNEIVILPLYDRKSDEYWSKVLDEKIKEVEPVGSVVLYGSRDSFIPHYLGKYDTIELVPKSFVTASEVRKEVSKRVERTKEFRAGVIYGAYNNFATVHPVIDVAIMNEDDTEVLLGRKKLEKKFRFIGGFVDVTDKSLEQTVKREAEEETGLEIGNIEYITSTRVNDWRYKSDPERSVLTTFFKAKKIFGAAKGNDDIEEVKWHKLADLKENELVTEHNRLLTSLKNNIKS